MRVLNFLSSLKGDLRNRLADVLKERPSRESVINRDSATVELLEPRQLLAITAVDLQGPSSADEGQTVNFTVTATADQFTYVAGWDINWGDGTSQWVPGHGAWGQGGSGSATVPHTYADGTSSYTVIATPYSASGYMESYSPEDALEGYQPLFATKDISIQDVEPVRSVSAQGDAVVLDPFTLNLNYQDVPADPALQWTIDWGDGSPAETIGGGATSAIHTYTEIGTFQISGSVTNDDGIFAFQAATQPVKAKYKIDIKDQGFVGGLGEFEGTATEIANGNAAPGSVKISITKAQVDAGFTLIGGVTQTDGSVIYEATVDQTTKKFKFQLKYKFAAPEPGAENNKCPVTAKYRGANDASATMTLNQK